MVALGGDGTILPWVPLMRVGSICADGVARHYSSRNHDIWGALGARRLNRSRERDHRKSKDRLNSLVQPAPTPSPDGILLQATIMTNSLATDLNGNLVWYYPGDVTFITRPEAGGYFFG